MGFTLAMLTAVESLAKKCMSAIDTPGTALARTQGGGVIYSRGFGVREGTGIGGNPIKLYADLLSPEAFLAAMAHLPVISPPGPFFYQNERSRGAASSPTRWHERYKATDEHLRPERTACRARITTTTLLEQSP